MRRARGKELLDRQHHHLRRGPRTDAQDCGRGEGGGHQCGDCGRRGGDGLLQPDRAGGASFHSAEHQQRRGIEVLCPLRRRGGAGARTEPEAGAQDIRCHPGAADNGADGRAGAHRDVLPRGLVHGRIGQVLSELERTERFGQPGRLYAGVPPLVHREGQGKRHRAGGGQQVYHVAEGLENYPFHGRDD